MPGYQGQVKRPALVRMNALNENGEKINIEATGLLKKAICHELDHLDGIVYTDIAESIVDISDLEDTQEDDSEK